MTDLEICEITARMCGKFVEEERTLDGDICGLRVRRADALTGPLWDPINHPEQAMECLEELLKRGYDMTLSDDGEHFVWNEDIGGKYPFVLLKCPAREFFARALAEIGRMEKTT